MRRLRQVGRRSVGMYGTVRTEAAVSQTAQNKIVVKQTPLSSVPSNGDFDEAEYQAFIAEQKKRRAESVAAEAKAAEEQTEADVKTVAENVPSEEPAVEEKIVTEETVEQSTAVEPTKEVPQTKEIPVEEVKKTRKRK